MLKLLRRSLLNQLLGLYLLFVGLVLITGLFVNNFVQQQLRTETHNSDLRLANSIAVETDGRLHDARISLAALAKNSHVILDNPEETLEAFQAFMAARPDVDRIYWLDPNGILKQSLPSDLRIQNNNFSHQRFFQQAHKSNEPIIEAGIVDLATFNAVVTVAVAVYDSNQHLVGVLATNLRLDNLSQPLLKINTEQKSRGQQLLISIVDNRGQLAATPQRERLLQPVLQEIPGVAEALAGQPTTRLDKGPHNQQWLYSVVPVPNAGWAVIVQRPASEALAGVNVFTFWLTAAALLFGAGGLFFWIALLHRVIRPLQNLAKSNRVFHFSEQTQFIQDKQSPLIKRADEVGELARSLYRLEQDVFIRLNELHTLLETSNTVVGTLNPHTVVTAIIYEVLRLVNLESAGVMVADTDGVLRVLACSSHQEYYAQISSMPAAELNSILARALREGRPVQVVFGEETEPVFPMYSYREGFRALLAIPLLSPRVGNGVLLVNRKDPHPFSSTELELLLTFANYATLAWEHAILYERSDEKLSEIALENEKLYRRVVKEKQTLAAIISSMSDGLVLTASDGTVLYTNPGIRVLTGMSETELTSTNITMIHAQLRSQALVPENYDKGMQKVNNQAWSEQISWWVEVRLPDSSIKTISLRPFDVQNETGQLIGQGLLLRDITQEHEIEEFKTTLLAAVGHELRTPLTAIKGNASTLLADDVSWSPQEQRHFLVTISSEADRIAQLISNLLDLSRLEAGILPLHPYVWQLEALIQKVLQHSSFSSQDVSVNVPSDINSILVDGPRIEVVLRNLVENALTYGDGGVKIQVEARDNQALIQVINSGTVIAPEELPYIFERFYRAQYGRLQQAGGTGLGLAICKAFVKAHGGNIWAESSMAGGTVISFTLPLAS